MPADATTFLAAARNAVSFVKAKVPYGAANRFADYGESYEKNRKKIEGKDPNVVDRALGAMTAFLPLLTGANRGQQIWNEATGNAPADPVARFRQVAEITMRTGAGNCNEQSIVAFMFLYDRGLRPLAWMHLTNGKHAFVVLGRTPKSGIDPTEWGDAAVVCDPWNNEAYALPAAQASSILQTRWGCGTAKAQYGVE